MKEKFNPSLADRLTLYLVIAQALAEEGRDAVTSRELGERVGVSARRVREDLKAAGSWGTPGIGFQTRELVADIRKTLGLRVTPLVVAGAGKLGRFIATSGRLRERGFVILDVYDSDPQKVGRTLAGVTIKHPDELKRYRAEYGAAVGVICTPAPAAQRTTDLLAGAGVRVMLDYTNAALRAPEGTRVHRTDPPELLLHTLCYLAGTDEIPASRTNNGTRPQRRIPWVG